MRSEHTLEDALNLGYIRYIYAIVFLLTIEGRAVVAS